MSYPGTTSTKFGRTLTPEPPLLERLHLWHGEALREVAHPSPLPVLDQEDLLEQGIHTSHVVSGARDVDALGSCVFNASACSLAERLPGAPSPVNGWPLGPDAVAAERWAISLYHLTTAQTGDPASEWPPTDCGYSGLFVCQELERLGLIHGFYPVTLTPTSTAAATCLVDLSPDNTTYSALITESIPAGTALDSFVLPVRIRVPAGWYVRLTATNATLAASGTYY